MTALVFIHRTYRPLRVCSEQLARGIVISALLVGILAFATPATSLASVTHPLLASITAGQLPCGGLQSPLGLTADPVDEQLYVLAHNNAGSGKVLDTFSLSSNQYECVSSNTGVETPQKELEGGYVTVAEPTGDVYVANNSFGGVVDVFGPTGSFISQFTGKETPSGSMLPYGTAIGPEGDVYVSDIEHHSIDRFTASGKYVSQFSTLPHGYNPRSLAVAASGDVYVILEAELPGSGLTHFVAEFTPTGTMKRSLCSGDVQGIAIDTATDDLFCVFLSVIDEYSPSGTFLSGFGPPNIGAANSVTAVGDGTNERIYVSDGGGGLLASQLEVFGAEAVAPDATTGESSEVHQTSATLSGAINPASASLSASYQFEYFAEGATPALTSEVTVGTGTASTAVTVHLAGLAPDTAYHYRLLGYNANADRQNGRAEGEERTFITTGPPAVNNETSGNISSTSATLQASLLPNGSATHYYFEYGTSTDFGSGALPVEGADIGSGRTPVSVSYVLTSLSSETEYHYRVVVQSAEGTAYGPDQTFRTFAAAVALPDDRSYELVSRLTNGEQADTYSPGKLFEEATAGHVQPIESAPDGNTLVYSGDPTSEGNGLLDNEYLAQRTGGGWEARDISPPTQGPTAECSAPNLIYAPYDIFTTDLNLGITSMVPTTTLTSATGAPACYLNLFIRDTTSPSDDLASYKPLITARPSASVPFEFGFAPPQGERPLLFELVAGTTSEFGQVFFAANYSLAGTDGAKVDDGGVNQNNLYERGENGLQTVNVLPGAHESTANASFGSPAPTGAGEEETPPNVTRAVSSDGDRVFWTDLASNPTKLFVREDGERTVQLDEPHGVSGSGGGGHYWIASSDGSDAFFTDSTQLTSDATAGSGSNLYRFQPESQQLSDLTGDLSEVDVQGVLGASESGAYLYFVAKGNLTGDEQGADGEVAAKSAAAEAVCQVNPTATGSCEESQQDNLYLYDTESSHPIRFLARLSDDDNDITPGGDGAKMKLGDWRGSVAQETARVTPDGRFLVLVSREQLTSYVNDGHDEVYLFSVEGGGFVCASCDPTGEAPTGEATLVPDTTNGYQPRWVTDDGSRVFFDSDEALAAGDTNHTWDVYEYEGGHDYLISSGTSPEGSFFDDATPSGNDVFFTTRSKLTPEDQGEDTNVWDARVGGGFPYTPPTVRCSSEPGCRPVASQAPSLTVPVTTGEAGSGQVSASVTAPAPVTVLSAKRSGGVIRVGLRFAAKGRLTVTSGRSVRFARSVKAGTLSVAIRLTAKAAALVRHGGRFTLTLVIKYVEGSGRSSTVRKTVAVKGA